MGDYMASCNLPLTILKYCCKTSWVVAGEFSSWSLQGGAQQEALCETQHYCGEKCNEACGVFGTPPRHDISKRHQSLNWTFFLILVMSGAVGALESGRFLGATTFFLEAMRNVVAANDGWCLFVKSNMRASSKVMHSTSESLSTMPTGLGIGMGMRNSMTLS